MLLCLNTKEAVFFNQSQASTAAEALGLVRNTISELCLRLVQQLQIAGAGQHCCAVRLKQIRKL